MEAKNNVIDLHKQRIYIIQGIYQFYIFNKSAKEIANKIFKECPAVKRISLEKLEECLNIAVDIEYIIDDYLNDTWSFWRLGNMEKAILIFAIYELSIEDLNSRIIIDEAIKISKKYANFESYKLINGVLDSIAKDLENIKKRLNARKNL